MSWDVVLIKTETNLESMEEISSPLPCDRAQFIQTLKQHFPSTDCQDEAWPVLNEEQLSIEFNVGEEPVQAIMLNIRGSAEPIEVISVLCAALACRAYDTSAGEFIEVGQETAFGKWKQYRDEVVGGG